MKGTPRHILGSPTQLTYSWKTIHGLSNKKTQHKNNTITFKEKTFTTPTQIANAFNKQFTNTVKHKTHKTKSHIDRTHSKPQTTNITLTTTSKNNNSTGPDKVNIRHLKHIGPLGLAYLTNMYNTSLNNNIIPHAWKLANIIPIPKPNKDMNIGTSYRPISLLSVIAKTLEKSLLPYTTNNIPHISAQHGFKCNHFTGTALHNTNNTIAIGFNQNKPP